MILLGAGPSITNINPRHIIHVSYGGKNEYGAELSNVHLIDGSAEAVIGAFHRNSEALAPIISAFPGFGTFMLLRTR